MLLKPVATLSAAAAVVFVAMQIEPLEEAFAATDGDAEAKYLTAPITQGSIITSLSATGRLGALVTVSVGSQLSGQVSDLRADFNDTVRQGDVLARLDPRSLEARAREAAAALEVARFGVEAARSAHERAEIGVVGAREQLAESNAALDRARIVLGAARRDYRRVQSLSATISRAAIETSETTALSAAADLQAAAAQQRVSEQRLLAAEAEARAAATEIRHAEALVEQQSAILDQARIDLDRSVIRSPIAGVVISRDVNLGQTVAASLESPTLFTIAKDLSRMEVIASVDEADISRVQIGQEARFHVDAYPDRTFEAVVSDIHKAPRITQNVVAYTVILAAENPDLILLPGMTASVRLVTASAEDVLKIPLSALYFQPEKETEPIGGSDGGQTFTIWLARDHGPPAPRRVSVGRSDDTAVEIVGEDLKVGQEVVVGTTAAPEAPSLFSRIWSPS